MIKSDSEMMLNVRILEEVNRGKKKVQKKKQTLLFVL